MKTLELFAGAGGAALGLEAAGFEHLACVEWDEDACATLEAAGLPAVRGDVRDLSLYVGMAPDLLWSSFPCQAWSTAGKRKGAQDERNMWPATEAAIDFTGPTWFVGENVVGLTNHKGACKGGKTCIGTPLCPNAYFHQVILKNLEKHFDWVGWRVLDSADFGVPQRRRRVFLVGGPRPIKWPEPTHGNPNKTQEDLFAPGLKPWNTVRQALGLAAWGTATGRSGNGVAGVPKSADTPSCQPVAGGNALGGLYGWDEVQLDGGRNSDNNPNQERPHTLNEPAPTVNGKGNQMLRVVGNGNQMLRVVGNGMLLRVIGGGTNPRSSADADKRSYRDITNEPCTTIAASQIGNAGPWIEVVTGLNDGGKTGGNQGARSIDEPSPTVRACQGTSLALRAKWRKGEHPELLDRPSALVSATEYKGTNGKESTGWTAQGGPARASDTLWLATGRRRLTVEECARLMDFPDGHPFQGSKQSRYRQAGNAVTPIVAQRIAEQIAKAGKANQ